MTNLGHCHPRVTKAAQAQCATLVHGQVNIAFNKPYLGLIEKLLPVMPHKSLDTFFFWCVRRLPRSRLFPCFFLARGVGWGGR